MRVARHARSADAVKQAVKYGVDYIGHANYLDDEACELLDANKDKVFVGPAMVWELPSKIMMFGFAKDSPEVEGYAAELEATIDSSKK